LTTPPRRVSLGGRIDAMIEEDPGIGTAAIWQRLADDHGVTVAYHTLRPYVICRRAAQQPLLTRPESMTKPDPESPRANFADKAAPCPLPLYPRSFAPLACWPELFGWWMISGAGHGWLSGCRAGGRGSTGPGFLLPGRRGVPAGQPAGRACRRAIAAVTSSAQGHRPASRSRRRLHWATVHRADAAIALGAPYELSAGLGMQATAVRRLGPMSATYLTSTLTGILQALAIRRWSPEWQRSTGVLLAFAIGAVLGGLAALQTPAAVPAAVLVPLAAVVTCSLPTAVNRESGG
jgi:hypothetical protein